MRKKRIILLAILHIAFLGGLAWWTISPHELVYKKKTLTRWLDEMDYFRGGTNDPAFTAFQAMGSNAVPALLRTLQDDPSGYNNMLSVVQLPLNKRMDRRLGAAVALYAIGTNAKSALPVLTNLLFQTNDVTQSTIALAGIGSEAVPILLTARTNQSIQVRHSATIGLGFANSDFNLVVPALIASLKESNRGLRHAAAEGLGKLHARADLAVPALIANYSTGDPILQQYILISLGEFGSDAADALPIVIGAMQDPDPSIRHQATNVILRIDPEAAAKAGVK